VNENVREGTGGCDVIPMGFFGREKEMVKPLSLVNSIQREKRASQSLSVDPATRGKK
jgi:hypothetical protein